MIIEGDDGIQVLWLLNETKFPRENVTFHVTKHYSVDIHSSSG